jgi:hypothetical protein
MDEVTWRTTTNERTWMMEHIRAKALPRRLRLFACACVRRLWERLPPSAQEAVEITERFAEGLAMRDEMDVAAGQVAGGASISLANSLMQASFFAPALGADACLHTVARALAAVPREQFREELAVQCDLIRCVFGNPFRLIVLPAACLETSAVRSIAQVIALEQRWADLPILADALEDAGCVDEGILTHCRSRGVHGRGCWVVDLILGKS